MPGENYLFAYLGRAFPDYYTAGAGSIINLNDGSLVVYFYVYCADRKV